MKLLKEEVYALKNGLSETRKQLDGQKMESDKVRNILVLVTS